VKPSRGMRSSSLVTGRLCCFLSFSFIFLIPAPTVVAFLLIPCPCQQLCRPDTNGEMPHTINCQSMDYVPNKNPRVAASYRDWSRISD
jgi:hypothetical protein